MRNENGRARKNQLLFDYRGVVANDSVLFCNEYLYAKNDYTVRRRILCIRQQHLLYIIFSSLLFLDFYLFLANENPAPYIQCSGSVDCFLLLADYNQALLKQDGKVEGNSNGNSHQENEKK